MRGRTIVLIGVVLFACPVSAQEVTVNLLFLPDEAAECRYLETLSAKATEVLTLTKRQLRHARGLYEEGKTDQAVKYFDVLHQVLQDTVQGALSDVADGIEAEKRKRGTLPSCATHIETIYNRQHERYVRLSRSIRDDARKVSAALQKRE